MACDLLNLFFTLEEQFKQLQRHFYTSFEGLYMRLRKKQTSVFLHPHVSSPHVCLLCIYVT